MWPHSSILICYWFSCDLIPAYWGIVDFLVNSFIHTNVLLILRWPHSTILMCYYFSWYLFHHINVILILMGHHANILKYYWFWCGFIPVYWCVIDYHGTSFQHTNVLLIDSRVTLFQHNMLLILMGPHASILKYYWFSGDLILAY